jgi:hypothetical protein
MGIWSMRGVRVEILGYDSLLARLRIEMGRLINVRAYVINLRETK